MTILTSDEFIIEPDLPIVDSHHHLWCLSETALATMGGRDSVSARALAPVLRRRARYLFDEFLADARSGHNIRASVFIDSRAMYRADGPEVVRSVGEVEFANGVAAMAASGLFGEEKVCAAIVGGVDLKLGDAVEDVLTAHIRAGGGRYRGVRSHVAYDDDQTILFAGRGIPSVMVDDKFRKGVKRLQRFGLSLDVSPLEPQLPDLIDLAYNVSEVQIVLNHLGTPLGIGRYAGLREARFPIWRDHMRTLARCENVVVKLGGLGVPFAGFESHMAHPPYSSERLSSQWKPYIETCIEAFGVHRCMFESNFPADDGTCSYAVLWNAFKRLTAGATEAEKTALFSGTATRVYRLDA